MQVASASGSAHDAFYGRLYASLWHESMGEAGLAKQLMLEAVDTRYALQVASPVPSKSIEINRNLFLP